MTPADRVSGAVAAASTTERTAGAYAHDPAELLPAASAAPRARVSDALKDFVMGRLWLRDLIAVAVLAAVMRAIFEHAVPASDQTFALIWGRDLIHGHTPDLTYPGAPTAHPLAILIAALASMLGQIGAVDALVVLSYLCLGAVLWGTYRLGEAVFSRLVGVLAVLLLGSSYGLVGTSLSVYLDLPYLALVVWAAVLEVRRPRRGTSVLMLLTLAALLRPEAAVLAAGYWIYACWRSDRRWASAMIVLVAPLGWVLMALAATGDPWYTVGAQKLGGAGGAGHTDFSAWTQISAMVRALRLAIRGTALVGAVAGFLLALRLRRPAVAVPALIVVLVMLTYGGFVVLGLAVPDRMLLAPGVMLTLFCGVAVGGWIGCRSMIERRVWAAVGIVVLALLLASVPSTISGLSGLASQASGQQQVISDLSALRNSPASRSALRSCRPISVSVGGLVGFVAYYLDEPLRGFRVAQSTTPTRGTYIAPSTWRAAEFLVSSPFARQANYVPAGFQLVARNRSWNVYTRGC